MKESDLPYIVACAIIGSLFWIIGSSICHFVYRREFYRRNSSGVQEFSSYGKAVIVSTAEGFVKGIGRILLIIGRISIFIAIVGSIISYISNRPKYAKQIKHKNIHSRY